MAGKNIMREIGETMEKIFYKKKEPKPPVKPPEEPVAVVEPVPTPSPWQKATDLDAKMKKKLKDAGVD